jgi:hypothetical protein
LRLSRCVLRTYSPEMKWLRGMFQSSPPPTAADHESFVRRLEALGFFAHASRKKVEEIEGEIRRLGWPGVFSHEGRFFHADAEELAEGGILGFLGTIAPFLATEGVTVPEIQEDLSEDRYRLKLASSDFEIYGPEDVAREATEPGRVWAIATVRTFELVNQLLATTKSQERLYAVNGGNDLFGLFLTQAQFSEITSHAGSVAPGAPYQVQDDPPWYGDRH